MKAKSTKAKKAKASAKPARKTKTKPKSKLKSKAVQAEIVDDSDVMEDSSLPVEAPLKDIETVSDEEIAASAKAIAPSDPVAAYLAEIKKYPLLSKEKEFEIAVKYFETKDPKLAQILVTSNLRFVVKVAAEYAKFGAKLIDLIQEGNIGLMHSVREFNPYKGVRLITYAVWWIRGYIREYLLKQFSMVKIGTTQAQKKLFYNLAKEREAIQAEGLQPTTKLISSRLGVPEKDVEIMSRRLEAKDLSLDQPLDDESKTSFMDLQKTNDEEAIDEQLALLEQLEILKRNIDAIKAELNERELFLLENRLLADNPLTLQEIGDKYKVTREAVRQMEERLIGKIKERFHQPSTPELLPAPSRPKSVN